MVKQGNFPKQRRPLLLEQLHLKNCFREIIGAIWYTDRPQPKYLDHFHDIRQMQDEWNKRMANKDFSLWWDCLEKSMLMCLNPHVPGWMVVSHKPHPFGNEYHTICDNEFRLGNPIMWHVELQEGKDWLAEAGPKKRSKLGKTVSLMLRIHKVIAHQGKACTMDSGFGMSMGIVELEARLEGYGQALIKQQGKNWPMDVLGALINKYFNNKPFGYCKTLQVEFNGNPLYIHCMKEEKYMTK